MDGDGKEKPGDICNGVTDQDKTLISKIMQRFRPIAPKPTVGESSEDTKSCRFLGKNRRSKRKYVRVRDNKNNRRGCNNDSYKKNGCEGEHKKIDLDKKTGEQSDDHIITLQLLPERERDLGNNGDDDLANNEYCSDLSDMNPKTSLYGSIIGLTSSLDRTVVESWLTVESVSDTCTDLGGYQILELGHEGEDRVMRILEVDTCPWIVSDGSNRICWINQAYRRMMGASEVEVIRVWLVVAMDLMEKIACMVELYGAVTCRVRVRYEPSTWKKMTVPCDVWRIRPDWFAWRLDVESALRLGM